MPTMDYERYRSGTLPHASTTRIRTVLSEAVVLFLLFAAADFIYGVKGDPYEFRK